MATSRCARVSQARRRGPSGSALRSGPSTRRSRSRRPTARSSSAATAWERSGARRACSAPARGCAPSWWTTASKPSRSSNRTTRGAFAAYELGRGEVGTIDIARAVEGLRPALRADHIVIASDHSHAGQDLIGVWGGVPNEYLAYVKAQAVAAIVEAYDQREPADLRTG